MTKNFKKMLACGIAEAAAFMNFAAITVHAEGDVAGAVTSTWNSAKS